MKIQNAQLIKHYTAAAAGYASSLYHELDGKPLDRLLLRDLADSAGGSGVICDLGCGPGHAGAFLKSCGAEVCGVDLSPGMVEEARSRNTEIPFTVGDMLNLQVKNEWEGIAAFYSIVHFSAEQLAAACRCMYDALKPAGLLLLSFHIGSGGKHVDEFFGVQVDMDFVYWELPQVLTPLTAAGFDVVRVVERAPYDGAEYPSRRGYVLARKR